MNLVRVLRVAHQIASPERIAPIARRVGFDVRRCPAGCRPKSDSRRDEELHTRAPRCRELRIPIDRSGSERGAEIGASEVGRTKTAIQEWPNGRIDLAEVI